MLTDVIASKPNVPSPERAKSADAMPMARSYRRWSASVCPTRIRMTAGCPVLRAAISLWRPRPTRCMASACASSSLPRKRRQGILTCPRRNGAPSRDRCRRVAVDRITGDRLAHIRVGRRSTGRLRRRNAAGCEFRRKGNAPSEVIGGNDDREAKLIPALSARIMTAYLQNSMGHFRRNIPIADSSRLLATNSKVVSDHVR